MVYNISSIGNETINITEILRYCGSKACINPNYDLMLWFNFILLFILFFEIPGRIRDKINFEGLSEKEVSGVRGHPILEAQAVGSFQNQLSTARVY